MGFAPHDPAGVGLQSERFSAIIPVRESPTSEPQVESLILDLLADRDPARAREFLLAWGERRTSSWANAAREAAQRAASVDHLPQVRGQLRYHLGEIALAEAAGSAKVGHLPVKTTLPGGVFIVARVGRFALVSLMVREKHGLPRRSITRKLLSQRNEDLEPQHNLFDPSVGSRGITELAYFGCVVAVPWRRDPTTPAEMVLAIPDAGLTRWLAWMPLHWLHARLLERGEESRPLPISEIPDKVFPKFRVPKEGDAEEDKRGA
jgi:hypothetical protein